MFIQVVHTKNYLGNDAPSSHTPEAMNSAGLGSLDDESTSQIGKEQKLNALPLSVQQQGKSVSVLSPQVCIV